MATVGAKTELAADRTNTTDTDGVRPLGEREGGPKPRRKPLSLRTVDLGPWPENPSLRREDVYGDHGR